MLRQLLVGVVADRVALHRIGLEFLDRVIDLLQPSGIAGGEDRVREHAPRFRQAVHVRPCRGLHLVGEEPVLGHFGRRAADERDLRVAVEVDFLQVVVEHEIVDRLFLLPQRGIPPGAAHGISLVDEAGDARARAQEMRVHVHDELPREAPRALVGHLGGLRFRARDAEERSVGFVHREERGRHPRRGLEEAPARHPQPPGRRRPHLLHPRLEFALLLRLRPRHEFVAGDRLDRDRRGIQVLGGRELAKLVVGQHAHGGSSGG